MDVDGLCQDMAACTISNQPRRPRRRHRHYNHKRWNPCGHTSTKITTPNGLVGYIEWRYSHEPPPRQCMLPKMHRHCCCNVDIQTDVPRDTYNTNDVKVVNGSGKVCTFEVPEDGGLVTTRSGVLTTHMPQYPQPTPF